MSADKSLKGAEAVFLALLTIGLMGLLFLIIYGNLSGNLGWTADSTSYDNETINLSATGNTPTGASGRINGVISPIVMTNFTDGTIITSGNYTVVGVVINATTTTVHAFGTDVNVTYTVSYDGSGAINTDSVIGNLTSGATQFFTFSNVWFILTAITILIGIVLGVITLVRKASGGGMAGNQSRSEFAT